jgi:hypothetical protein
MWHENFIGTPDFEKCPENFPVTTQIDNGDEFATNCLHHQTLFEFPGVFDQIVKPDCNVRCRAAIATRSLMTLFVRAA